ncbi:tetrahydrofolate synthase [Flavobacterium cyanobacteriorum]|uniref:Dihydrofolate synthase/folylpolyglutamate synthase n=1 Tax=Flavobacterium cyanobacteriorum TaxID=2022802 RepID=A0A255Z6P7_9FLAO|nr:Mur ligase family protein [Flavobacterium cyanobacteriorum]OYQ37116.1 tetrahydrofolate synthase [Flavobacterium cyanobacteriorum]
MDYKETVEWMFRQLPMYQHQGASAYKKDLTNTLLLTQHLGHPEKKLRMVHVAGTNGKGSVSNMLASVFQQAGYKTGLYTSPHLKDFRERIKINGQDIPEDFVCRFIYNNKPFFESRSLSFFEMTVGLAFTYFAEENVDIAVIETGLGGRLDSTNVIIPVLSVITNIGMDHMQFLGNTPEAIAGEKAGIIKAGIPVVIGEYTEATQPVFNAKAQETGSPIYFASDEDLKFFKSDLKGDYQEKNIKTVLKAVNVLQDIVPVSEEDIRQGLLNVVKNTGFAGRWHQIHKNPAAICDTAHNSHGLSIVMEQVKRQQFDKLHIVFGVVNDKDLDNILPLLPVSAAYYFCRPDIPRGLESDVLKTKASVYKLYGSSYNSAKEAYAAALQNASPHDFVYIGGSTFVVAEII